MTSQIIGLNRQLNWASFRVRNAPPPGADVFGNAAMTQARFQISGMNLVAVDPGRSQDLKLEDKITMTVSLDPAASWVASWLRQRSATDQARLLRHEQGHYDLVALLARDCFEQLVTLRAKTYTSGDDLQSDVSAISQRFSSKTGPVQERYDAATDHGAQQPEQDKWNRLIRSASDDDLDPPTPAVGTPLLKKPLLDVLATAGIIV